jgi:hypothetical protein
MTAARVHSFDREGFTLWAFRADAIHGRVSLFTLWTPRPGGGQDMAIGAVRAKQIRQYFNAATQQEQTS